MYMWGLDIFPHLLTFQMKLGALVTVATAFWRLPPSIAWSSLNHASVLQDMATVRERRTSAIIGGVSGVSNISSW